jgi:hypothetical protein
MLNSHYGKITTAVSFIYYKMEYMVANYLDDLGGAETVNKACDAYDALGGLLAKCGTQRSFFLRNQASTNNEISITLSGVTSRVSLTVSTVMPKNPYGWWVRPLFAPTLGFSIMSLENWSSPDEVLSSDACLDGFGAISSNQFFHALLQ